jgi:hypothetical protein
VRAVEQSLRRMRTGHLDLVQVHMSPPMAALVEHETVETLRDLQRNGKVRFIGIYSTLPTSPITSAAGVFFWSRYLSSPGPHMRKSPESDFPRVQTSIWHVPLHSSRVA